VVLNDSIDEDAGVRFAPSLLVVRVTTKTVARVALHPRLVLDLINDLVQKNAETISQSMSSRTTPAVLAYSRNSTKRFMNSYNTSSSTCSLSAWGGRRERRRNMAPFWASEISSSRSRFRLPVVFIRTNLAGRLRSPARSASQIRRLAFLTSRGVNQRGHRDGQLTFRQLNSDTQSVAPSTSSFSVSRSKRGTQ
jgi:hypothetical protein